LRSREITDDLDLLIEVLPLAVRQAVLEVDDREQLIEIVMDLGRLPEARLPGRSFFLGNDPVDRASIDYVVAHVGAFNADNRAGIERTLHRISAIRNRQGAVVGLTLRIGRAVYGTVDILRDVIEADRSLLLLGRPGIGKTTLLREAARVLSSDVGKRVVVVDTSNEIAGDGDIPHEGIGRARRMQVPHPDSQHAVMIEAVENHMPEVVVIDEIGTEQEALAARTIAERGVQLIATAHGNSLENLLMNPTLSDLLGGIQAVTLGDIEARRRRTQKTVLERKAPPTFDTLVEIQTRDRYAVYHETAKVVDALLRGRTLQAEVRLRDASGGYAVVDEQPVPAETREAQRVPSLASTNHDGRPRSLRIFPYGVSRDKLIRAINELGVPATIARTPREANQALTLKGHEKRPSRTLVEFENRGVDIAVIRSNTISQIRAWLEVAFGLEKQTDVEEEALREARLGVHQVLSDGKPVELAPQVPSVRRLQHLLVEEMGLGSYSRGEMPWRRVVVLPTRG